MVNAILWINCSIKYNKNKREGIVQYNPLFVDISNIRAISDIRIL